MTEHVADLAGDAFPGQEPQATSDREQLQADYTVTPDVAEPEEYNWSMSGTHVSVSNDDFGTQFGAMAWTDFTRPHAYGTLELQSRWTAVWHIAYSNMSLPLVEQRLKKYTRDQGWDWGDLLDKEGNPVATLKTARQSYTIRPVRSGDQAMTYEGEPYQWGRMMPRLTGYKGFNAYDATGAVVGTVTYHEGPSDIEVGNLWVDPSYSRTSLMMDLLAPIVKLNKPLTGNVVNDRLRDILERRQRSSSVPGIGEINPGVKDWKNNDWAGTGQYDNPGADQSDTPFYGFQDYDEDVPSDSPRTCSECGDLCLDYDEWRKHVLREHVNQDRKPPSYPQPVVDLDDVLPAHFDEAVMDKTVQRQSRLIHALTAEKPRNFVREAQGHVMYHVEPRDHRSHVQISGLEAGSYVTTNPSSWLFMYEDSGIYERHSPDIWQVDVRGLTLTPDTNETATPGEDFIVREAVSPEHLILIHEHTAGTNTLQISGPIPFIYDIEQDRIHVGHPGERHSDIQGRFTPGGVIEGLYDPKGNVQIRTDTDMPYTVRHMAQLWYAMHPELQIKAIYLMVGQKKFKLASAGIGHTVRNLVATDPAAWAAFQALEPLGNVYAVGGVVRDVVLGKEPKDVDLMVQGVDADDVERALKRLPGRVDFTGKQFGVFRYRDPEGNEVEVALPRTERSTGSGHRDFDVVTNPYISVGEDLARRDFTGNAMAVNLSTGDLVDPYHGSEDLKSGTLRTVSDQSFPEDPLRILRAFSQVSRHGLDPAPETYKGLAEHAHSLNELPAERLQMELDKIMAGSDPAKAIDLMEATGVLQHVLSDVAATEGFDQKSKYHALPLNEHLKAVLRATAMETSDVDVRWAALLHDIGKVPSQWIDDHGYGHYYLNDKGEGGDHEEVGAEMARMLLAELKFPNDRIERIVHLIRHHMFPAFSSQTGARKFINRVGDGHADDLLTLRNADSGGKGLPHDGNIPLMRQYVQSVRDAGEPTDQSMLAINGNDLIAAGFQPGPQMGQLLRYLTNLVVEDPSLNDRETLMHIAVNADPKFFDTKTLHGRTANVHTSMGQKGNLPPIQIHEVVNQDGDPMFVASLDQKEIGWLVLRPMIEPDDLEFFDQWYRVGNVTVESEWRRFGVATALFMAARGKYPVEHDWDQMTSDGEAWADRTGSEHSVPSFPDKTMTVTGDYGYQYVYQWQEDLHEVRGREGPGRLPRSKGK